MIHYLYLYAILMTVFMFTVNSPGAVRLRRRRGVRSAEDVVFVLLELLVVVVVVFDGVIIPLSPPVSPLLFLSVFLFFVCLLPFLAVCLSRVTCGRTAINNWFCGYKYFFFTFQKGAKDRRCRET